MAETHRRRDIQTEFNTKHGITPQSIQKGMIDTLDTMQSGTSDKIPAIESQFDYDPQSLTPHDAALKIKALEDQMYQCAAELDFERAAQLRDEITEIEKAIFLSK